MNDCPILPESFFRRPIKCPEDDLYIKLKRTPKQKKRHNEYLRTLKRDQIVWTITGEVIAWDVVKRTLTYRAEGVNELGVKFTGEAMEKDDQLQQITNIKVKP